MENNQENPPSENISTHYPHNCPVCYENKNMVELPCSHGFCVCCLVKLDKCAICRFSLCRKYIYEIQKKAAYSFFQRKRRRITTSATNMILLRRFDGFLYIEENIII
jgi:hypothetical protein